MKLNRQRDLFRSKDLETPCSRHDLGRSGTWMFFTRNIGTTLLAYGVWHCQQPLAQFSNTRTRLILDLLQLELVKWLDPWSMEPAAVPEIYRVAQSHVLPISAELGAEDIKTETLRVILDYVELIGEKDRRISLSKLSRCHITWSAEDTAPEQPYPAPDLRAVLSDKQDALLLLMRCANEQDGGVEHMYERYLWPAFRLLFDSANVVLRPNEDTQDAASYSHSHPLLFISESPELTDAVRTEMAQAIFPTLQHLIELYGHEEVLPQHCFVYGLHMSRMRMTIFVHLPIPRIMEDDSVRWEFAQLFVVNHFLSFEWRVGCTFDDVFLWRWRLTIALCTIARHVQVLRHVLGISPKGSKSTGNGDIPKDMHPKPYHVPCEVPIQQVVAVPSDWVTPETFDIDTAAFIKKYDITMQLPYQLASLAFHPIRRHLTPMSRTSVLEDHFSTNLDSPDFLHPLHVPRTIINADNSAVVDEEANTRPHFFKARDFLTMTSPRWEDVNIFIANIFAGFSEYAVRWKPIIQYPFDTPIRLPQGYVVDFALAAQTIPPTVEATILRAPSLPLTISGPAVLLGVRSISFEDDGRLITDDETKALTALMEPHLRLFRLLAHQGLVGFPGHDEVGSRLTLFCTYLKRGYVHLLTFSADQTQPFEVVSCVLDSFPLSLDYSSRQDLCDRMRIVMSLFTVQRRIVKICESWRSVCCPADMLLDEHDYIVEVTGVKTPTLTESIPPPDQDHAWWWDLDSGSEDDPEHLGRLVARSMQVVSEWLTTVEPPEREEN